ncbi:hypothetical protein [Lacinutrix himadriensis]|jgi:hypothetical protein|uniref:hypothetical protein n=1 Tax=Lacinutrix himadriensis TaxID=641549 RepID=UPI0006E28C4D|nr:hypothetical protein [Lacinutrix himadriensis]
MNKIVYKRKVPIMKFIFGLAFFVMGLSWLTSGNLFGLIICGIAAFFFHSDGSEIDLETKKYRTIISFFGLHFGKWKDLPAIDYVSVFATSETTTVRALSAEANVSNAVIQLNLFYNGNQKITAYTTTSKEDAFTMAKKMAEILSIDVLDATKPESEWL